MKKYLLFTILTTAVLCVLLVAGATPPRDSAIRWEYAQYLTGTSMRSWNAPNEAFSDMALENIAIQMKMPYQKDKLSNLTLLNFVGSKGWELISITRDDDNYYTYYFKRPK